MALPSNLYVGASSWSSKGWVGPFYPEDADISAVSHNPGDEEQPEAMPLVSPVSLAVQGQGNGLITHALVVHPENPLYDRGDLLVNDGATDDAGTFMALAP